MLIIKEIRLDIERFYDNNKKFFFLLEMFIIFTNSFLRSISKFS
jgi:hypothetical protein